MDSKQHIYECPDSPLPPRDRLRGGGDTSKLVTKPASIGGSGSKPQAQPSGDKKSQGKPAKKSFLSKLRLKTRKSSSESSAESSTKQRGSKAAAREKKQRRRSTENAKIDITSEQVPIRRGYSLPSSVYRIERNVPTTTDDTLDKSYEEDDENYTLIDEQGLPPPPLPTRQYLLDRDFAEELTALESSVRVDSQDDVSSDEDGYVPLVPEKKRNDSESDDSYIDMGQANFACPSSRKSDSDHDAESEVDTEDYVNVTVRRSDSDSDTAEYENVITGIDFISPR